MRGLLGLLGACLLAACSVDGDPARVGCSADEHCPDGWLCPDVVPRTCVEIPADDDDVVDDDDAVDDDDVADDDDAVDDDDIADDDDVVDDDDVTDSEPLVADPAVLVFGGVEVGSSEEVTLTLTNQGTGTHQLLSVAPPSWDTFAIVGEGFPLVLSPGDSQQWSVVYAPQAWEDLDSVIAFETDAPGQTTFVVPTVATGLAPQLLIDPASYDFGSIPIGCAASTELLITNTGNQPLEVGGVALSDQSSAAEFALPAPGAYPAAVAPGDSLPVAVDYTPGDTVPDTGGLVVLSNDPQASEATASLAGEPGLGLPLSDVFVQESNLEVDVLFVVDSSGSMEQAQLGLANNVTAYLLTAQALGLDYQLGVVSMDVAGAGILEGAPPIVTPSTVDGAGVIASTINLGVFGSATEQGLDTAYLTLSSPNTDPAGPNAGFLREGAGLRLVFLTDEPDQSTLLGSPGAYTAFFQGLKANPAHVVASDISGGATGCTDPTHNGADPALGYNDVVAATGGVSASICGTDWSAVLATLADGSVHLADTFTLSDVPQTGSVGVALNAVPIYVGWQYDGFLNAVVFEADYVPANGDTVEISYSGTGAPCP